MYPSTYSVELIGWLKRLKPCVQNLPVSIEIILFKRSIAMAATHGSLAGRTTALGNNTLIGQWCRRFKMLFSLKSH